MKPPKDKALIIFIKAPRLGEVKTRLQPELSPGKSLRLYKAMGEDLVERFSRSSYFDLFIHYLPEDGAEEMQTWLGMNLSYLPQQGSDLGEKLQNAFAGSFERNYEKVCITGSDLPTLTENDILEAYERLESSDVVLGPTLDGGYYLVALKKFHPQIFESIDWSSEYVFKQTLLRIRQQNLTVSQMAVQRDIDTYEDVLYLWEKLSGNENSISRGVPNTVEVLREIFTESK